MHARMQASLRHAIFWTASADTQLCLAQGVQKRRYTRAYTVLYYYCISCTSYAIILVIQKSSPPVFYKAVKIIGYFPQLLIIIA